MLFDRLNSFLNSKANELPDFFRDEWIAPEWRFGQVAVTEPDDTMETRLGFYSWMENVLDPGSTEYRIRFPSNSAGPDIIFVLCNKTKTKVLPVFAQVKFDLTADVNDAFRTVDPDLFHRDRGTTPPAISEKLVKTHSRVLEKLKFPVVRIVLSHRRTHSMEKLRLIPFSRGGRTDKDLCLLFDMRDNEWLFGRDFTQFVNQF